MTTHYERKPYHRPARMDWLNGSRSGWHVPAGKYAGGTIEAIEVFSQSPTGYARLDDPTQQWATKKLAEFGFKV